MVTICASRKTLWASVPDTSNRVLTQSTVDALTKETRAEPVREPKSPGVQPAASRAWTGATFCGAGRLEAGAATVVGSAVVGGRSAELTVAPTFAGRAAATAAGGVGVGGV